MEICGGWVVGGKYAVGGTWGDPVHFGHPTVGTVKSRLGPGTVGSTVTDEIGCSTSFY